MSKTNKTYHGVATVLGRLSGCTKTIKKLPVHGEPHEVDTRTRDRIKKELESKEATKTLYDFRGSYPVPQGN